MVKALGFIFWEMMLKRDVDVFRMIGEGMKKYRGSKSFPPVNGKYMRVDLTHSTRLILEREEESVFFLVNAIWIDVANCWS